MYVTLYKGSPVVMVDCGNSNELKEASEGLKYLEGIESKILRKD